MKKYIMIKKVFYFALATLILSCSESAGPTPPTAVSLSLPNNNENCNTGTSISNTQASVEFSWSQASSASSYSLTVKNMQTNAEITRTGITTNSTTVDLNKGYAYEWYVTSNSEDYPTDRPTSATWRFYLQGNGEANSAPFPADLLNPKPGEVITLVAGAFEMQWAGSDPDGDALSYTLYVDKIDGKQTTPEDFSNLTDTAKQVSLEANSIYYWRVQTQDVNGNTTFSQVKSFRIE